MKRIFVVFALIAAVVVTGCDVTTTNTIPATLSGVVVDAQTNEGRSGVTVRLENTGGTVLQMTTSASGGVFTFENMTADRYVVTATENNNWAFLEQEIDYGEYPIDEVEVLGFYSEDEFTISVFVQWNSSINVDANITFPDAYLGTDTPPKLNGPYMISEVNGYLPYYYLPSELVAYSSANRELVRASNPTSARTMNDAYGITSDPRSVVELISDSAKGPSFETIAIRGIPFPVGVTTTDNTSGADVNLPTGNYSWLGSFQYYVEATSGTLSEEGARSDVEAVVYVTKQNQILGRYTVSDFTNQDIVSVLRIHMFLNDSDEEVFQILPDQRVVVDGAVGILSTDPVEPIVVTGRARQR